MERFLMDYLANATWQIPLLAVAAWAFIRIGRLGPQAQHCVWLAVLGLAVGLPFRGVRADLAPAMPATCAACSLNAPAAEGREAPVPAAIGDNIGVAGLRWLEKASKFRGSRLRLAETATGWLTGTYFAILLIGLYRIASAWRGARRLVKDSQATVLQPRWNVLFEESGRKLRTSVPQLRKSGDVGSPVIVGAFNPVLLLPQDFDDHSRDEARAAFYHELAHVRRHDYLGNIVCQLAALPVVWHPAIYGVQQRIRRTREMACDAIAAREMQSEIEYAKCLLAMAGRTVGHRDLAGAQAMGLFGDNVLEERIMRLMQQKSTMTMPARMVRIASGATAMIIAVAMAVSFHLTPTMAQSSGTAVTVPAPPPPDMAVAPLPPVAPVSDSSAIPAPPVPPVPTAADTPVAPVVPPAPDGPVTAVTPVTPIPPVAPVPAEAKPSPRKKKVVGHYPKNVSDKSFVIDVNGDHALAAEQQAQFQKDMAAMDAQLAEATKHLNSPEFQRQMADLAKQQTELKNINLAKIQQQIDAATAKINSPEFKQQMEKLQKQMESGEMQRSMAEASKRLKEAEAQQQMNLKALDMSKIQEQIDAATAKINSPEFKQQMEKLQKQMESGEMQRSMEEATKQLKAAEAHMGNVQTK